MNEKTKITLSPSSINLWQACKRKFQFEKLQGFFPREKGLALEQGDLLHKLLEYYYLGKISNRENNVTESINEGRVHALSLNLESKEISDCVQLFSDYALHFSSETWIPLAVEKPFTSQNPIHTTESFEFYLEFRIDLLVQENSSSTPEVFAVDHKSKSKKSYPNPLNNQYIAICYGLGLNKMVENVIYKQKTMDGNKLTFSERYPRRIFEYTDDQIHEWELELKDLCEEYEKAHQTKTYNRNLTSCDKYGGCSFVNICSAIHEVRSYKLERDFKRNEVSFDIFSKK